MDEQGKKNIVWGVFLVFIAVMVIGVMTKKPWSPDDAGKTLARQEFDFCLKQSQDESKPPAERARIAVQCLDQQSKFREKYKESP